MHVKHAAAALHMRSLCTRIVLKVESNTWGFVRGFRGVSAGRVADLSDDECGTCGKAVTLSK